MSRRTIEQTIDIETAGATVPISLEGATIVSLHIRGQGAADYVWDARRARGSWVQDVGPTYTGQSNYDDVVDAGDEEARIRCTSGTGTPGDEATVTIMAGGG